MTVKFIVLLIDPDIAVMLVTPFPKVEANPAMSTVATPVLEEVHVTKDEMSFVELSEYVPTKVECQY